MNMTNDLINNKELIKNIVEDLEDFDGEATVTYEVWAIGYDCDNEITDAELLLGSFEDPDKAVEHAKQITLADVVQLAATEYHGEDLADTIAYISVEVETVVENENDGAVNIGTIYKKELWINEDIDENFELN